MEKRKTSLPKKKFIQKQGGNHVKFMCTKVFVASTYHTHAHIVTTTFFKQKHTWKMKFCAPTHKWNWVFTLTIWTYTLICTFLVRLQLWFSDHVNRKTTHKQTNKKCCCFCLASKLQNHEKTKRLYIIS